MGTGTGPFLVHLHAALLLLLTLTSSRCPKPCISVVSHSLHHRSISLSSSHSCITFMANRDGLQNLDINFL